VLQMREFDAAARSLGLEVVHLEIRRTEDIAPAFESERAGRRGRGDGVEAGAIGNRPARRTGIGCR
jgi:hypothetical protein